MNFESFAGFNSSEGMSESSLEELKEKMKAAAAQIAAIKKEEGKQKKKEDELIAILFYFIKNSSKKDLTSKISKVLAQNIPARFVLAVILLGNKEIQRALKKELLNEESIKMLENGGEVDSRALTFFKEDQTLPLRIKIELDAWIKEILKEAEEVPQKLLASIYEVTPSWKEEEVKKKSISKAVIDLMTFITVDYFDTQEFKNYQIKEVEKLALFLIKGIISQVKNNLENRKHLN